LQILKPEVTDFQSCVTNSSHALALDLSVLLRWRLSNSHTIIMLILSWCDIARCGANMQRNWRIWQHQGRGMMLSRAWMNWSWMHSDTFLMSSSTCPTSEISLSSTFVLFHRYWHCLFISLFLFG